MSEGSSSNICIFSIRHITMYLGILVSTSALFRGHLNQQNHQHPGEGNGYPLKYSCLENTMDRGAWRATVHWVANNQT